MARIDWFVIPRPEKYNALERAAKVQRYKEKRQRRRFHTLRTLPSHTRRDSSGKFVNSKPDQTVTVANRRKRVVISKENRMMLEMYFNICKYPDKTSRDMICSVLGMSESQVFRWFDNRRYRQTKKMQLCVPKMQNT